MNHLSSDENNYNINESAKFMKLIIDNSERHAVKSKWKDPGAALYNQLLNTFHCVGDVPVDTKELNKAMKNGTYKQWPDFIKEAYLIAPVDNINNSPYGVTSYSRSGCKYPHHVIRDGKLLLSIEGLKHAYEIAWKHNELTPSINRHLNRHFKELGIRPWFHHGQMVYLKENATNMKIEENFRSIENMIYEHTGIDLYCPTTLFNESVDDKTNNVNECIEIKESLNWIESFVNNEEFRESEYILYEASHGKLKYDFRMGWDYNTGNMIKVVYSLDNINITDVGDFYYNYDGKKDGATHDSHLKYTRDNIKKKGNTDHQSTGQKVLSIIDIVTNKKLQEVKLLNPFCPNIKTRNTTQTVEDLKKAREAANNNPNFLNHIKVGEIDNNKSFKSTHWASRVMDKETGENLRFNKISKSELLKSGRGWKVNNIDAKDFPVYGNNGKYMIYHNPNKKQALQELRLRERDSENFINLNADKPGFANSRAFKAELNNLRIIQNDIQRIENGSYDLSMMKKYREYSEGQSAGLSGLQLLEYTTYMDFRPSKTYIDEEGDNIYNRNDDDLDWMESYLMEDVEPKHESNGDKYEIINRKSKYKGWTEYIVLTKDGNEAASCIINPNTGDCANVETKPEYRRQGYIKYLLKYLVKFKGVKYAQVQQDNRIAISLYRKIGFEVEFKYTDKEKGPMYSMVFNGDISKLIVEGYNIFIEADEPPSIDDNAGEEVSVNEPTEETKDNDENKEDDSDILEEPIEEAEPEKNIEEPEETAVEEEPKEEIKEEKPKELSRPKQTDAAESDRNGKRRKKLYIAFIEWCKEYNNKNIFGSIFDKDAFKVSYPFVPDEMRYFYRLANPMLCILGGQLTFFPVAELRKLNSKNTKLNEMMIFAATPKDVRVFNRSDKKVYIGTEENGSIKLGEILGDTFDIYIQNMIQKGNILEGPIEESVYNYMNYNYMNF